MSSNEYVLQSCPQFVKGYCRNAPNCDAYHPMPTRDVQTVLREMSQIGADHSQGRYFCQFCQVLAQGDFYAMVGTVSRYRYCNLCGVFYFFPQVQELVRLLLDSARGDYLAFRRQVCECRGRLPALLQIPFTYEAHKWATARFAWTLCGPTQATQVLELLFRQQPFQRVLSMGAGTGYVEHVFNGASQSMRRPLEFLAFDQTPVGPGDYSVKVQRGGPEAFARLGDLSLSILLLCWPPFGSQQNKESTMASDCLKVFHAAAVPSQLLLRKGPLTC